MTLQVNIKKYNINDYPINPKILVIGSDKCERTKTLKNITRHYLNKKVFNETIIISSDDSWNDFYHNERHIIIPNCDDYEKTIENIWNDKKNNVKVLFDEYDNRSNINVLDIAPKLLLVIDNYTKYVKHKTIIELFMMSRHYNVTHFFAIPYSLFDPQVRGNTDIIFLCKESNTDNINTLYQHFGYHFPNIELFTDTINKLIQNDNKMVIKTYSTTQYPTIKESIEGNVSWFNTKLYKLVNKQDWTNCLLILNKSPLWSNLHKDIKQYMKNYFYIYSY